MRQTKQPEVTEWPELRVGKRVFSLKLGYTAAYNLQRWGVSLLTATRLQLAAAMACEPGDDLKLRNCGFQTEFALAELIEEQADIEPGFSPDLETPVAEAVKKAYPELTILFPATAPEETKMPAVATESGSTEESKEPGHSPVP